MIMGPGYEDFHYFQKLSDFEVPKRTTLDFPGVCDKLEKVKYETCGSAALSVLTSLNPGHIERQLPGNRVHWTDASIIKFLHKRGFKTLQLTKRGITSLPGHFYPIMPISDRHVLLVNSLVCHNEASYFVIYKGFRYHNFEATKLDPLFLINKPPQNVFLVHNPKW